MPRPAIECIYARSTSSQGCRSIAQLCFASLAFYLIQTRAIETLTARMTGQLAVNNASDQPETDGPIHLLWRAERERMWIVFVSQSSKFSTGDELCMLESGSEFERRPFMKFK